MLKVKDYGSFVVISTDDITIEVSPDDQGHLVVNKYLPGNIRVTPRNSQTVTIS